MFEVTGTDISNLDDADLRTLVARLALAELRKQGCPLSAVTAGGDQDAADGGVDVRVQCSVSIASPDFVPLSNTGFQVKKPKMPPSAISNEMRPKPTGGGDRKLRQVICELATVSGAYIIVSSQDSVADRPLADRRSAMREALHDLPNAADLYTDFYDRDRLATWVNEYPGVAAWVRNRTGLGLSGWSSIGGWTGTHVTEETPYLFNDKACLTDERSRERERLTIAEGIERLRAALRTPKQCIRLIGLSGLGKTRFVQALFESGVGEEPLDPSVAIYTDYSAETIPTARDMARQLLQSGQRAILVVDNCNPATHAELARICSNSASKVSLLTVEYDVRDDEPELTGVFRLQSASTDLVAAWLKQSFPDMSQVDQRTIADFSDGNFRVARALAETLGRGETLGKLKSRELFERLFQQRNHPDQNLLVAAEELSLLYSVNGEDTSGEGELARIGTLRSVSASTLYAALAELRRRGIAQVRGRWRAILPQAIANQLATYALQRISPPDFDRFSASLTPRMQRSLSRRLGYLHDSSEAQATVARWLRSDGALGDLVARGREGLYILTNIAPIEPEAVLAKLTQELNGPNGASLISLTEVTRWQRICLIKALGYELQMFDAAASLLARFLAAEPDDYRQNSVRSRFGELFQLYLSGTQALPEQRRAFVRLLARSGDADKRRCASVALNALLTTRGFSSSSNFDFGARSRDWGWLPKVDEDVGEWFDGAIDLAVELSQVLPEARGILAKNVRGLWGVDACHDALDRAASALVTVKPWIEGWISFRAALRFEGNVMPERVRMRLETIIERLKPLDLLNRARAIVFNRASGGWDITDCESDDGDVMKPWRRAAEMARDVGRQLANDRETRASFLTELMTEPRAERVFECGLGLAEGASDLAAIWRELAGCFETAEPNGRNATVLGGFIYEAHRRDSDFGEACLEAVTVSPALSRNLPYLQARIGIDENGIARLRRAIGIGAVQASDFANIACGVVGNSPPEALANLLGDIATLPGGVEVALDILHMRLHCDREADRQHPLSLIVRGRELLCRAEFSSNVALRDYGLHVVIQVCCAGNDGESTVREVCAHICSEMEVRHLSRHDLSHVLKALFDTQPVAALDVFLLPAKPSGSCSLRNEDFGNPIENMDPEVLRQWADREPAVRYKALSHAISMFKGKSDDVSNGISPLFLDLLDHAPDKQAFLGDLWTRFHPRSWSGSLASILTGRKSAVMVLRESPHEDVRQWVDTILPNLDRWVEQERLRDQEAEESFE
ncbi:hypothetical protein [Methyloversatilis discipulorum]|uniref:hypothetical protein n=1 Tax=Methyloversatilis discipulorum TaxID=1119528 RepID=UPI0003710009|nr:hypothetical protein [Methyloversatilis discipulorum]